MPFGLTNAPAFYQHMMNDIFREYLDDFVVIYLDDILIFSKNEEDHENHVHLVLSKLREMNLYAKLEKCEFHQSQVEWVGYILSPTSISMDRKKIQTIIEWATPCILRDVQCFLGFANFYRIFIKNYSKIATPLTCLTGKEIFSWNDQTQEAFDSLKKAFFSAPILIHVDFTKPFFLEIDAPDYALRAILSQYGDDGHLYLLAFYSRKFTAPEINYEIHDKELLAIVASFEVWRHFLEGAQHQIIVYTDHKNLEYFMSAKVLNCRQACWSMFLSQFNFVITYRHGNQQGKFDALSRHSYLAPKEGMKLMINNKPIILKPERLNLHSLVSTLPKTLPIIEKNKKDIEEDLLVKNVKTQLELGEGEDFEF
jgi:hypothetical protein